MAQDIEQNNEICALQRLQGSMVGGSVGGQRQPVTARPSLNNDIDNAKMTCEKLAAHRIFLRTKNMAAL
eukprot:2196466-Pyramimonas_sp.AAC.1